MQAIVLVFIAGLALNTANAHPHNADQASAAIKAQFTNPVIVSDDSAYANLNHH